MQRENPCMNIIISDQFIELVSELFALYELDCFSRELLPKRVLSTNILFIKFKHIYYSTLALEHIKITILLVNYYVILWNEVVEGKLMLTTLTTCF